MRCTTILGKDLTISSFIIFLFPLPFLEKQISSLELEFWCLKKFPSHYLTLLNWLGLVCIKMSLNFQDPVGYVLHVLQQRKLNWFDGEFSLPIIYFLR